MRFGISNLIFEQISESSRDAVLSVSEVCDFAPTIHYGAWKNVPNILPSLPYPPYTTKISALQSLFFGIQGASLLKDDDSFAILVCHFERLVKMAVSADIRFLIYGSPGTRSGRFNDLAEKIIHSRISQLADIALSKGLKLCFEVNSPKFGCEYLTTNASLHELLVMLAHPGLGLHLDVGQMLEEGVDVVSFVKMNQNTLAHLHLSTSNFSCEPEKIALYTEVLTVLRELDVDIVLEIQKLGKASELQLIDMCNQLSTLCKS